MKSYENLLQHPLWVIKRAKIINRDGKKCTVCESKHDLRVHHTFYYSNYPPPWEYPNDSLLTLCDTCHYNYHIYNEVPVIEAVKDKPKKKKLKPRRRKQKRQFKRKSPVSSGCLAEKQRERIEKEGVRYRRRAM